MSPWEACFYAGSPMTDLSQTDCYSRELRVSKGDEIQDDVCDDRGILNLTCGAPSAPSTPTATGAQRRSRKLFTDVPSLCAPGCLQRGGDLRPAFKFATYAEPPKP
jgi:hypothetical protein